MVVARLFDDGADAVDVLAEQEFGFAAQSADLGLIDSSLGLDAGDDAADQDHVVEDGIQPGDQDEGGFVLLVEGSFAVGTFKSEFRHTDCPFWWTLLNCAIKMVCDFVSMILM